METATAVELQEQAQETPTEVVESARPKLYKHSTYVDVPEDCLAEEGKRGSCEDPDHFHAWFRLPNKFQHREIREKALAAKARRARQLRDPDSDASLVLEDELEGLRNGDKEALVDEIVDRDSWRDHAEAVKDAAEIESEDQDADSEEPIKTYAHIEEDQVRLKELEDQAEEERPKDEYEELLRHVTAYWKAVDERLTQIQRPQRETLLEKSMDDLVALVRDDRIEGEATAEFLHTYNTWTLVYGTLRADRSGRRWSEFEHLKGEAPEVVEALEASLQSMEAGAREGNS